MQKKTKKQKTFDKQMLTATIPANLIAAATVFTYGLITMQLSLSYLWPAIKLVVPLVAVAQFLIAPFIDGIFTKPIAKQLTAFENGELDERKRTELVELLMGYPIKNFFKVIGFFVSCGVILCLLYKFVLGLPLNINLMAFSGYLFGAYFAGVLGFNCAFNNSSPIAIRVVKEGVNYKYVKNKKTLGTNNNILLMIFVMGPAIFSAAICFLIFVLSFLPYNPYYYLAVQKESMHRIIFMAIINIVIHAVCIILFYRKIWKKNELMAKIVEQMNAGNVNTALLLDTDLSDEISLNFFLTNQILLYFRDILKKSEMIGDKINNYAKELVKVSSETQSTVVEQSTGVREIVSTMEDANRLAHNIETSINDVTESAEKTALDVSDGSGLLEGNRKEIQHIETINEETIKGIVELNDRIESIWEVVNIINNIADQTKIIAFNAELEATSVAKTDFKNVSMEIRRLANTTMDSTKQIKQKINEIQDAANALIQSSHQTTEKIQKGAGLINSLEERFENIKESTQENATSANEIKMLVNQQTAAFEQIVTTLHQISSGIENFSISTRSILETSHLLEKNAVNLSTITTAKNIAEENSEEEKKSILKTVIDEVKQNKAESKLAIKEMVSEISDTVEELIDDKVIKTEAFIENLAEKTPESEIKVPVVPVDDYVDIDTKATDTTILDAIESTFGVLEQQKAVPIQENEKKTDKPKGLLALASAIAENKTE